MAFHILLFSLSVVGYFTIYGPYELGDPTGGVSVVAPRRCKCFDLFSLLGYTPSVLGSSVYLSLVSLMCLVYPLSVFLLFSEILALFISVVGYFMTCGCVVFQALSCDFMIV